MEENVSDEEAAAKDKEWLHNEEEAEVVDCTIDLSALLQDQVKISGSEGRAKGVDELDDFSNYLVGHELDVEKEEHHNEDMHQVLHCH